MRYIIAAFLGVLDAPEGESESASAADVPGMIDHVADLDLDLLYDFEALAVEGGGADGERHGRTVGFSEGRVLGLSQGREVGEELGRIKGAIAAWNHLRQTQPSFVCSDRATRTMSTVEGLVDAFPRTNPGPDADVLAQLQTIRAKFRILKSLLKVSRGGAPEKRDLLVF